MKLLFTLAIISLCTLARAATPATWQNFTIHTGTGAGLPPNAAGVLTNDGSGTLNWVTITGGGGSFTASGTPQAGWLIVATGTNANAGVWTNTLPTLSIDTLLVGDIGPVTNTITVLGLNGGYYLGTADAISNNFHFATPGDVLVAQANGDYGGVPASGLVVDIQAEFDAASSASGDFNVTVMTNAAALNLTGAAAKFAQLILSADGATGVASVSTDGGSHAWSFGALKSCSAVTMIVTNYLEVVINGATNAIPIVTPTP